MGKFPVLAGEITRIPYLFELRKHNGQDLTAGIVVLARIGHFYFG
jgi:hypothetical protein